MECEGLAAATAAAGKAGGRAGSGCRPQCRLSDAGGGRPAGVQTRESRDVQSEAGSAEASGAGGAQGIEQAAFSLLFAFDEVISLGYKENVTVAQVKQNTEMESHEEKLHKMIIQSKINDTKALPAASLRAPNLACRPYSFCHCAPSLNLCVMAANAFNP